MSYPNSNVHIGTVRAISSLAERATDNAASAGNLPLHLEVCDLINETDSGPKDAVAAIRKRLTGSYKNFHIINLTLTVSVILVSPLCMCMDMVCTMPAFMHPHSSVLCVLAGS